jgi:RNA polymerase sigma factor (TIGR02999 family)
LDIEGRIAMDKSSARETMADKPHPPASSRGEITLLLQQAGAGDSQAADRILPIVYEELRKLAAAKMARESPGQTLQPTALVHEAWLRLGAEAQPDWQSRAQFFSSAAEAMRRILIENARRRRALRHGGAMEKISADATGFDLPAPGDDDELLLLNDALDALAAHDPRKAELVKQSYFVGLKLEEIAALLGISARTADRDLAYAKAWLGKEILRLR